MNVLAPAPHLPRLRRTGVLPHPTVADVYTLHRAGLESLREPMAAVVRRGLLLRPLRRWQFAAFGKGSIVHRPAWVYGPHRIAIGDGVVILAGAWLSAERATWDSPDPAIRIGDGTMARLGLTISAADQVVVEENVLFAAGCSLIDSDHTVTEADHNPLWNPVVSEAIHIGAGSWLGERVTVLQGAHIGRKCVIGAGAVVRGTIPDGAVAAGIPARVL